MPAFIKACHLQHLWYVIIRLILNVGDNLKVRHRIQDLAPGGGYVVAPVHNVQADVPAENVIAMYQAALEYGRYPI